MSTMYWKIFAMGIFTQNHAPTLVQKGPKGNFKIHHLFKKVVLVLHAVPQRIQIEGNLQ